MRKLLIKFSNSGFTLVELLVVISILSVLAVVGLVVFRSVSGGAKDSRRKADVEAYAKAYEVKYTNSSSYQAVAASDFSGGNLPQDPAGGSYYNNLGSSNSSFRVCTALESNSSRTCSAPSTNCYCLSSAQGSYSSGGNGGSIDHPSSCDPNGTLGLGLVGYWKMDEASWNGTTGEVKDSSGSGNNGTPSAGTNTTFGKFNNAGNFNGVSNNILVADSQSLRIASYSVSVWIKPEVDDDYWTGIVGKPGRNFNMWFGNSNTSSGYIHHRFHDSDRYPVN